MKEALFYQSIEEKFVQCTLCPHHCRIKPDQVGSCKVRKNCDGVLYSLVYGHPVAQSVDPIEKKPLFHFYPGSKSFSIATVGCNLHCKHCQNADISQAFVKRIHDMEISAEMIVSSAKNSESKSIAYTYTEPTIFYEYAYDIARCSHENNLKNIFVTNGYISPEALEKIAPFLDGANIDLKAMDDEFYRKVCSARLQPVLDSIRLYAKLGIWIEITTLLIPGYNDDEKQLEKLTQFIYEINPKIPWHVTGFYPTYQLTDVPPTSISSLEKAAAIGKKTGLLYVYQGNRGSGEDTICPHCGKLLIKRSGFQITQNNITQNKCPFCQTKIHGIWS